MVRVACHRGSLDWRMAVPQGASLRGGHVFFGGGLALLRRGLLCTDDDDFEEDEEVIEHHDLPVEDDFDEDDFDDDFDDDFEEDSDDAEEVEVGGKQHTKDESNGEAPDLDEDPDE